MAHAGTRLVTCMLALVATTLSATESHVLSEQQEHEDLTPPLRVGSLQGMTLTPTLDRSAEEFFDINIGLGVVVLRDREEGRVEEARVRKGKIQVDKANRQRLGVMVEAHRLFRMTQDNDRWGHGPFVGLIADDETVVDAFAAGYMLAMRRRDGSQSFNIQLGLFFDPDAQVLANDFQEGDNFKTDGQVQYAEKPMWGYLFGASYSF